MVFKGEQEKESTIGVRMGQKNLSLGIPVCHHLASLGMQIGNSLDRFFYPTLMIDSYYLGVCFSSYSSFRDIDGPKITGQWTKFNFLILMVHLKF